MAAIASVQTHVPHTDVISTLARRISATVLHAIKAHATREALNKLSDHELEDIGLCRGDIARFGR